MKLAAHQPCFLPFISFFYKMSLADIFVLADDYQYTTNNFLNRTKIKTVQGLNWLTVPVLTKKQGAQRLNQVRINNIQNWRKKHWRTLQVNYVYAAYFDLFADFIEKIYNREWEYLVDLNFEFIDFIRSSLNIVPKIVLSSDLKLTGQGNARLFQMLTKLGCKTYLAGVELTGYLNKCDFTESNFELEFLEFKHPVYHQQFADFLPGMSVIDLLLNEGPDSRKIISGEISG